MSRLTTAHVGLCRRGVELTPFVPGLTLRVGMANRKTTATVPTLPTLPTGVRQRGRKSTPPFAPRARIGKGAGLEGLDWGGLDE